MGFISHSGAVTIRQEHVTSVFCIFATISLKGFIYPEKANEKPNLLSVRNKAIAEPFRAKKTQRHVVHFFRLLSHVCLFQMYNTRKLSLFFSFAAM